MLFCPFNDRLPCLMCIMEGYKEASYVGDPNAALSVCDDFFHDAFFDLLFFLHTFKCEFETDGFPNELGATFLNDCIYIGWNCPHSADTALYLLATCSWLSTAAL